MFACKTNRVIEYTQAPYSKGKGDVMYQKKKNSGDGKAEKKANVWILFFLKSQKQTDEIWVFNKKRESKIFM